MLLGVSGATYLVGYGLSAVGSIPGARTLPLLLLLLLAAVEILVSARFRYSAAFFAATIGMLGIMLVGLWFTRAPSYGLWKTAFFAFFWVVIPVAAYSVLTTELRIRAFLNGLLIGGLGLVVLVALLMGSPFAVAEQMTEFSRVTIGGANPIYFAQAMALVCLMAVWRVVSRPFGLWLILVLGFGVAAFGYAVLSGSKGPLLGLLIGGIAYFCVVGRIKAALLITAAGAAGSILLLQVLPESFVSLRFGLSGSGSIETRLELFLVAWEQIRTFGLLEVLLGRGTGDFGYLYTATDSRFYPHNILIESLYEWGVVGTTLVFTLIVFPLWRLKRSPIGPTRNERSLAGIATGLFVFSVVSALSTGDIAGNYRIGMFGAVLLAALNAATSMHRREQRLLNPRPPLSSDAGQ